MKTCIACGIPRENTFDFTAGNPDNYCCTCCLRSEEEKQSFEKMKKALARYAERSQEFDKNTVVKIAENIMQINCPLEGIIMLRGLMNEKELKTMNKPAPLLLKGKISKYVKTLLTLSLAFFTMLPTFQSATVSADTGDAATDWHGAKWIWDSITSKTPYTHDIWLMMRKTIEMDKKPDSAVAKISIDSRYWLYINGEMVVREGQQKNGPTTDSVYYDQVDLTSYLKPGRNVIAVYGNYWGRRNSKIISYSNYDTGKAGFVFDLDIDGKHVVSDSTWKVKRDPAHTQTSTRFGTYRLQECSAFHDARYEIPGWYLPDYDDSDWANAVELGKAPCEPWGDMYLRRIPQFKDYGLKEYLNMDTYRNVTTTKTTTMRMEVPYNAQLTPYLKVIDPEGGKTIEIYTDGMNALGATYITKASNEPQEWESFVWTNGQYVTYVIPEGVTVLSLQYRESGYDTEIAGYFRSNDEFMDKLWKMAARTLYVTMRDNYMDCPDRERAQWWGDTTNESHMTFYALDTSSYALYRSGVSTMIGWIDKTNPLMDARDVLRTVVPVDRYDGWTYELPMQQLAGVNGMWTYYRYTGETDFVEQIYEPVKTYLAKWEMGDDGLVVHRKNSLIWDWGDWGNGIDMPALENAWYYQCLKVTAQMAEVLGKTKDLSWFKERMESIENAYEKTFWDGSSFKSPSVAQPDERANAVAVISGLVTADKYESLIDNVFKIRFECSPYMEKYVEDAMFMMGYADEAIERIKKRYGAMVEGGYSTLSEHFPSGGTKNHAWSGGPLIAMSGYIAGIAPDEPGYSKWHVIPQMGSLLKIDCRVPAIIGNIDVSIERNKDSGVLTMNIKSPGKTAEIWVPVKEGQKAIQTKGNNAKYLGIKEAYNKTYAVFEIKDAGSYEFKAMDFDDIKQIVYHNIVNS